MCLLGRCKEFVFKVLIGALLLLILDDLTCQILSSEALDRGVLGKYFTVM